MLKDVFVQACGPGVFPGVGFTVMGSGCLCRRLVMARGGLASELLLAGGRHCWPLGRPAEMYTATIRDGAGGAVCVFESNQKQIMLCLLRCEL